MTQRVAGTLTSTRSVSPARWLWLHLALRMAVAGWVPGPVGCGGPAVSSVDAPDDGDDPDQLGDRSTVDTVLDDAATRDDLSLDTADGARPPLYGVCVPGRERCSADGRYVELCSSQGQWEPFADCEALRWRLPDSGLLWECGGGVGLGTSATCHQCASTPGEAGCALGFCAFGGSGGYPPGGLAFASRCDDDGATLTLYASVLSPMCPREIPYPEVCESSAMWAMWCTAPCACTEGVYEVRDSAGVVAGTGTYGSCGDSLVGRPDYWADDVTRAAAPGLLTTMRGVGGECYQLGTFWYMGLVCVPVGSGYCAEDEHCPAGQNCNKSSLEGTPSAWAMGLDYPHCE
jgi:hypothetical protein